MHNHVILTGRFTETPELRTTAAGVPVCRFSIAVQRKYNKNVQEQETDFFNIEAWRGVAEFVSKYFDKGDLIEVCGSLRSAKWTDEEKVTHYKTFVCATEVSFAPTNNRKNNSENNPDTQDSMSDYSDIEDMPE